MFPLKDNVPSKRFPFINYLLIAINLIIFVHELKLSEVGALEGFMNHFTLIPAHFFADPVGQSYTVVTAMFLHGGWAHVLGNMWFLFIFGDNVEDNMGHVRYLFYYLLAGIGAAAAQLYFSQGSRIPMLGASGAIAGVLGGYVVLYPGSRILTAFFFIIFLRFIEVPAFFFLFYWFIIQALSGVGSLAAQVQHGDSGGVAWWAHTGGFLAGFILLPFFRTHRSRKSLL
jgi:membrane associated rhomboid family serine protease